MMGPDGRWCLTVTDEQGRPIAHASAPARYPACSRAATRSDLDHTLVYDKGDKTCECNLSAVVQVVTTQVACFSGTGW
jgi:hypothetical protein